MTVEQANDKDEDEVIYQQVSEVVSLTDRAVIQNAIKRCRRKGKVDLNDVINLIVQETNASKTVDVGTGAGDNQTNTNTKNSAAVGAERTAKTAKAAPIRRTEVATQVSSPQKGVIDLTKDDYDLQKALTLSAQDMQSQSRSNDGAMTGILGGQVSREEQVISRVLEASIEESKAGNKRKRTNIGWGFVDPQNPFERRRKEKWPVGLKNVGNTCWFSAVVQSFFYLPKFRNMVLNYKPGSSMGKPAHMVAFMQELRKLFGLLVGSNRQYIDPTEAIDLFKEAFTSNNPTSEYCQQDVSECQHKLIEWLEDIFKPDGEEPRNVTEAVEANPMRHLFSGVYAIQGTNNGEPFQTETVFNLFSLQVSGFEDLHATLNAATAKNVIEALNGSSSQTSGQEIWFTRLPPVLTFELSRFNYNKKDAQPEKIHSRLTFPRVIYMDRYMECNQEITRQKREMLKMLKQQLSEVQQQLDRYLHYGSGPKRFPLQEVLHYALEFAESSPSPAISSDSTSKDLSNNDMCSSPSKIPAGKSRMSSTAMDTPTRCVESEDVDMQSPKSQDSSISMQSPGPDDSMTDVVMSSTPAQATQLSTSLTDIMQQTSCQASTDSEQQSLSVSQTSSTSQQSNSSSTVQSTTSSRTLSASPSAMVSTVMSDVDDVSLVPRPHPKSVSVDELSILQNCLTRWRTEVEVDVKDLQLRISSLEKQVNCMYSDEKLKKFGYRLHAVMVHEGSANSGHYWACISSKNNSNNNAMVSQKSQCNTDSSNTAVEPSGSSASSAMCSPMDNSAVNVADNNSAVLCQSTDNAENTADFVRWLKYNDGTIQNVDWSEVERDSIGGYHNTSAYCLVYVSDALNMQEPDPVLSDLPADLQAYVENDNKLFNAELEAWENRLKMAMTFSPSAGTSREQTMTSSDVKVASRIRSVTSPQPSASPSMKASPVSTATASARMPAAASAPHTSPVPTMTPSPPAVTPSMAVSPIAAKTVLKLSQDDRDRNITKPLQARGTFGSTSEKMTVAMSSSPDTKPISLGEKHAAFSAVVTREAIMSSVRTLKAQLNEYNIKAVFYYMVSREMDRLTKQVHETNRSQLDHVVAFMLAINVKPDNVVDLALLQQFAFVNLSNLVGDRMQDMRSLVQYAAKSLEDLKVPGGGPESFALLKMWHRMFHQSRTAVACFVEGISLYYQDGEHLEEALPYFCCACDVNEEIIKALNLKNNVKIANAALNPHMLYYYRRQTMLQLNEGIATGMEVDTLAENMIARANTLIIPCMAQLERSSAPEDETAVSDVRAQWCNMLCNNSDNSDRRRGLLEDLLTASLSLSTETREPYSESELMRSPRMINMMISSGLSDKYREALRLIVRHGDMDNFKAWDS